jgi:archaemetzincin
VSYIYFGPLGGIGPDLLGPVENCLLKSFGLPVRRWQPLSNVDFAWDPARGQYSSVRILQELLRRCPTDAARVLAITAEDLYIPMLSFVYGQAQLNGKLALVSVARLRQEYYGMPPEAGVLEERCLKEILHEMGHTFGLLHCADSACAMSLSTSLQQVDIKQKAYCAGCAALLAETLQSFGPGAEELESGTRK